MKFVGWVVSVLCVVCVCLCVFVCVRVCLCVCLCFLGCVIGCLCLVVLVVGTCGIFVALCRTLWCLFGTSGGLGDPLWHLGLPF